jgi:hypothetical protein
VDDAEPAALVDAQNGTPVLHLQAQVRPILRGMCGWERAATAMAGGGNSQILFNWPGAKMAQWIGGGTRVWDQECREHHRHRFV